MFIGFLVIALLLLAPVTYQRLQLRRQQHLQSRILTALDPPDAVFTMPSARQLKELEPEMRATIWAVAVLDWFNADILAVITGTAQRLDPFWSMLSQRPFADQMAQARYAIVARLPFVESSKRGGSTIESNVRHHLRTHLWHINPELYRQICTSAGHYASWFADDDERWLVEEIYYKLLAGRDGEIATLPVTLERFYQQGKYVLLSQLLDRLLAAHEAGQLNDDVCGYCHYWRAHIYRGQQNFELALEHFEAVNTAHSDRLMVADTYRAIADHLEWLDLNRSAEAISNYITAFNLFSQLNQLIRAANCLLHCGHALQRRNEHALAEERFQQAQDLYYRLGTQREIAYFHRQMGDFDSTGKRYLEAHERYKQAMDIYDELGDFLNVTEMQRCLAYLAFQQKQYLTAHGLFAAAARRFHILAYPAEEAVCWINAGHAAYSGRALVKAQNDYRTAFDLYAARSDVAGKAEAQFGLGAALLGNGEYEEATQLYKDAISTLRRMDDFAAVGRCLMSLGDIAINQNRFARAHTRYQAALDEAQQADDQTLIFDITLRTVDTYIRQHELAPAKDIVAATLKLAERYQRDEEVAHCHFLQGQIDALENHLDQAHTHIQKALTHFEEANDLFFIGRCHQALGWMALHRGEIPEAYTHLGQAEIYFDGTQEILGAAWCNQLNSVLAMQQGKFEVSWVALENAATAYKVSPQQVSIGYIDELRGELSFLQRDYKTAQAYFTRALAHFQQTELTAATASCLNNLGHTYVELGELDKACQQFDSANVIFVRLNDKSGILRCQLGVAKVNHKRGHLEAALKLCQPIDEYCTVNGLLMNSIYVHHLQGRILHDLGQHAAARDSLLKTATLAAQIGLVYEKQIREDLEIYD